MSIFKKKVGEAVVQGTKSSLIEDIKENPTDYLVAAACVVGGIVATVGICHMIFRPRNTITIHIHIT